MKIRRTIARALSIILTVTMLAGSTGIAAYADTPDESAVTEAASGEELSSEESSVTETESETETETEETVSESEDAGESETDSSEEKSGEELSGEEVSETVTETDTDAEAKSEADKKAEGTEGALPYGLKGMPEGYVLSAEQKAKKDDLKEHDVLDALREMKPGYDYVEDEIVFHAASREEAELIADAYNAVLAEYCFEIALARISGDLAVYEAVELGMDKDVPLPAVEANYLTHLEKPIEDEEGGDDLDLLGTYEFNMPEAGSYIDWVYGDPGEGVAPILNNPDIYLKNSSDNEHYQWQHEMIDSYGAWSVTTGNPEIKVAVIDTGVDKNHPDLAGRVTPIKVGSIDETPQISETTGSIQEHGTHCAGIIAASLDNGIGGAGVAPEVSILSLNIFGTKDTYTSYDLAEAIMLAADYEADIISMSLGGCGYHSEIQTAVDYAYSEKNVTVIAAMGNDGGNLKHYPAGCKNVIAVSSVNRNGAKSGFTNYGSWADIAAPGSHIMSTVPGSGYKLMSGTSMATPVVAGVAALYMSKFGNPGPSQMEKILKASTVKAGSGQIGKGIINAGKLFASVKASPIISVYGPSNTLVDKPADGVPVGSRIKIERETYDESDYGDYYIIYTTNGKNPAVKNGEVISGDLYVPGSAGIAIDPFASNTTITVKAIIVSEIGTVSKVATLKIKTPDKTVASDLPVKTVKLDKAKVSLEYRDRTGSHRKSEEVMITTLTDKNGAPVDISGCKHEWISSNPKVAAVTETTPGTVTITATGKGSAKVTLKLLDGSKKTAVCNVTVSRLVDDLGVSGQAVIAPGASATYKVNVLPSTANNKKVTWEVYDRDNPEVPVEGVKISAAGKLTVGRDVAQGTVLIVSAQPKDGGLVENGYTIVTVGAKATKVEINRSGTVSNPLGTYDPIKKTAQIYSVNLPDKTGYENEMSFSAIVNDGAPGSDAWNNACKWTVSNTSVLEITGESNSKDVKVKALKSGTVKLTCALTDGSGKKAVITVKVITPASSITLLPNDKKFYTIAAGKSYSVKTALGTAYGKPTSTNVEYSKQILGVSYIILGTSYSDDDGNRYKMVGEGSGDSYRVYRDMDEDLSSYLDDAVTINAKTGKVSINKKKWEKGLKDAGRSSETIVRLKITATLKDEPRYFDEGIFYVQPAMKKFGFSSSVVTTGSLSDSSGDRAYTLRVWSDRYVDDISGFSSNAKVAGAAYTGCLYYETNHEYIYTVYNWFGWPIKNVYKDHTNEYCYFFTVKPSSTGSGKLTATVNDGSGKKTTKKFKIIK